MADRPNRFVPTLSSSFVLPLSPVSFLPLFLYFPTSAAVTATVIAAGWSFGLPRDRVPRFDASLNDIRSNGDRDTMRVSGILFVRAVFVPSVDLVRDFFLLFYDPVTFLSRLFQTTCCYRSFLLIGVFYSLSFSHICFLYVIFFFFSLL